MSDTNRDNDDLDRRDGDRDTTDPLAPDTSYAASREKQVEFQGLLEEKDGDFQAATDAQLAGEEPDVEDEGNFGVT